MTHIKHRDRFRQVIDFSTLGRGNRRPTDIDCLTEWKDKGYILIEVKHRDAQMPYGQMLAYKRFCDDFEKLGKESMFIVAEHVVDDCEKDVDISECMVRWFYYKGQRFKGNGNVKELYDKFINYMESK